MIVLEDKEFEKAVFEQASPIAVPVQLTIGQDGALKTLTFSYTRDIAEEFEARYASDPLGEEALTWLAETLKARMLPHGYDEIDVESYPLYDYRRADLNEDAVLPACELISTLEGEEWDDDLALDEFILDPANPIDRMAVMRDADGKIVCYAGLNDISEDEGLLEINVECAEEYRRRGYGTSCVVKLTDYLESLDGAVVQYITSHLNIPSIRLAEKAGLTKKNTVLPVVLRKSDEDDEEFFDFT